VCCKVTAALGFARASRPPLRRACSRETRRLDVTCSTPCVGVPVPRVSPPLRLGQCPNLLQVDEAMHSPLASPALIRLLLRRSHPALRTQPTVKSERPALCSLLLWPNPRLIVVRASLSPILAAHWPSPSQHRYRRIVRTDGAARPARLALRDVAGGGPAWGLGRGRVRAGAYSILPLL
jgi:hypothetical protein